MSPIRYEEARRAYALISRDDAALTVLMRPDIDGAPLRALGFEREGVHWRSASSDPARDLLEIHRGLGPIALYDLGTSFDREGALRRHAALPVEWPGRFLLHMGCTRHCLVFDHATDATKITRGFDAVDSHYFAREYHPATE